MTDIIELANAKQALFDHMAQEHNVTLLESEMQDIVTLCNHISSAQLLTQQEPVAFRDFDVGDDGYFNFNESIKQTTPPDTQAKIAELEDEIKRLNTGDNLKALIDDDTNALMQSCLEIDKTAKDTQQKLDKLTAICEEQKNTIRCLNDALGGEGSATTDNLVKLSRLEQKLDKAREALQSALAVLEEGSSNMPKVDAMRVLRQALKDTE
jgi:uncharacterized protein YukE